MLLIDKIQKHIEYTITKEKDTTITQTIQKALKVLSKTDIIYTIDQKTTNCQINWKPHQFNKSITLSTICNINVERKSIKFKFNLMQNGKILAAKHHQQKIWIMRKLNGLNNHNNNLSYKLDMCSGEISINQSINYTGQRFQQMFWQNNKQIPIQAKRQDLLDHILQQKALIYLIKQITQVDQNYQNSNININKLNQISMFAETVQDFQMDENRLKYPTQQKLRNQMVEVPNIFKFYTQAISGGNITKMLDTTLTKQSISQYQRFLNHATVKTLLKQDNPQIYCEIQITQAQTWQLIHETLFNRILRSKVTFRYKSTKDKEYSSESITRYLIRKNSKDYNDKHQKSILSHIGDKKNAHIGKFYYSNQQQFKSDIFCDYYTYKSLNSYIQTFSHSISLITLCHIFGQVAQGLRFLDENGISHLDIKPQNIMIGVKVVAKIIDFGESIIRGGQKSQKPIGFTIPYCPPEIVLENRPNQKSDVYSYCVMAHQILIGMHPIEFRQNINKYIIQKYDKQNIKAKILQCPQRLRSGVPMRMMIPLQSMLIRAITIEQYQRRPNFDWMVIFFRILLQTLDL